MAVPFSSAWQALASVPGVLRGCRAGTERAELTASRKQARLSWSARR